jgi:hypothetical protein
MPRRAYAKVPAVVRTVRVLGRGFEYVSVAHNQSALSRSGPSKIISAIVIDFCPQGKVSRGKTYQRAKV